MKRTLERLSKKRQEKQDRLSDINSRLQAKVKDLEALRVRIEDPEALNRLQESFRKSRTSPPGRKRPSPFSRSKPEEDASLDTVPEATLDALKSLLAAQREQLQLTREVLETQSELIRAQGELMEAADKEWDALGSNHVGKIFKSLEWRVDELQASCQDAARLMTGYGELRGQLKRLLEVLKSEELPTVSQVEAVTQPLEDLIYTGFEDRHRGSEREVKTQQEGFLTYFQTSNKVLDLGCGRGEFLDLLNHQGIPAEGVDTNQQMVAQCRSRGLDCRTADILEALSGYPDGTLGGIFSSQVIEHLPPDYLRRMVDQAFLKLAPDSHIVLETVNPTSLFALVHIYLLDLSHQKPIHPLALRYLLESTGFRDVEIRYSAHLEREALESIPPDNETAVLLNRNLDKLNELLFAPANYAAVGKKI